MNVTAPSVRDLIKDIKIIDADTHLTEPHDLWTSRAPASLKGQVPRVGVHDGKPCWIIGDGIPLSGIGACPISAVRRDGSKTRSLEFMEMQIGDAHLGAHRLAERLKVMDETHIFAQIVYPNVLGFGGQNGWAAPQSLREASIEIFNDAMAELQAESKGRLYPMALLPWWDPKKSAKEAERCQKMGLRGININSDPHTKEGVPDLAEKAWDALWDVCAGLNLPINFHIGASESATAWIGSSRWNSMQREMNFVVTSAMLFFGNARVMANILLSGILDRHPTLKFVSVESGIGWIPYLLEALEYQILENAEAARRNLTPVEYFERNMYGTFWFEKKRIAQSIRDVGIDNVMFETDFPHPTCLFPEPLEQAAAGLAQFNEAERRKILSGNAAKVYSIPLN